MMDPNETLRLAREASNKIAEDVSPETALALAAAVDLMMYFDGLDQWLTKGGFLPDEWKAGQQAAAEVIKLLEEAPKCCGADMEPVDFKWQCSHRSHHTQ